MTPRKPGSTCECNTTIGPDGRCPTCSPLKAPKRGTVEANARRKQAERQAREAQRVGDYRPRLRAPRDPIPAKGICPRCIRRALRGGSCQLCGWKHGEAVS